MRLLAGVLFVCSRVLAASFTIAQPPDGGKGGKGPKGAKGGFGGPDGGGKSATVEEMVARMMTLDKNMDGKLTKDEVTDSRLQSFPSCARYRYGWRSHQGRADCLLHQGSCSLECTRRWPCRRWARRSRWTRGSWSRWSWRRWSGWPWWRIWSWRPTKARADIAAPFAQETLKLTDEQKKQLADLQKDVDAKLAKILTDEQKKQLQEMRPMGPGGPGGGPGRGPGGPGRATAQ